MSKNEAEKMSLICLKAQLGVTYPPEGWMDVSREPEAASIKINGKKFKM